MGREILHCDANCFYAAVEMQRNPDLRGKPVAVCGNQEERHGIVLTASYPAKRRGVKTGMAIWQARQACPELVVVPPDYPEYMRISGMLREIFGSYTNLVEPFGLDEAWLDVSGSRELFGSPMEIAEEISARVKFELGITVSIGVSWNKIYAKLGSDYRKPDAITVFDRENYRRLISPLPVSDLLYVGRRTEAKLRRFGILTIGELARADPALLEQWFGKVGLMLSAFARGEDRTPVSETGLEVPVKSVGNSTTTPRDLVNDEDVNLVLYLLSESVAHRLRENGFVGQVVEVYVRDNELMGWHQQQKIPEPTNVSEEIESAGFAIFHRLYHWPRPIRSIGLSVTDLKPDTMPRQLSLFVDEQKHARLLYADRMEDDLRQRFGFRAVRRGIMLRDGYLASLDATADDHMIHPHSYLERGNRTGV